MSTSMDSTPATPTRTDSGPIWWSNATFFTSIHILAVYGIYTTFATVPRATLWLCLACWQVAMYGITIGYHRLWSHRAFTARQPLRFVLALMGTLGFQGSIKCASRITPFDVQTVVSYVFYCEGWCARHRLHVGDKGFRSLSGR
jgi:fatty-acid desaturase